MKQITKIAHLFEKILFLFIGLLIILIVDAPFAKILVSNFKSITEVIFDYDFTQNENEIIVIWGISLLLFFWSLYKSRKQFFDGKIASKDLIIIFIGIYYLIIRNNSFTYLTNVIELSSFSFIQSVKHLDIIFIFPINSLLRLAPFILSIRKMKTNSFWQNDKPIEPNDQDNYSRKRLALEISNQVNSFSDNLSFSIGIVGSWGSGKSSFLKMIKNKVKKCQSNIVFEFCPWSYPEEKELSMAFLQELEIQLRQNSFGSLRSINRYIGRLFENNGNFLSVFRKAFFPSKNLEEIKNDVAGSIENSGKRIVVIIDDIDRLRCSEVYEVLTIIRNIGNLPNMVFILAYDKDYLLKIMSDKIDDPQEYLSKFFQAEYALSKIPISSIKESLFTKLSISLSQCAKDKEIRLCRLDNKKIESLENKLKDVVNKLKGIELLHSERDVIKLMNAFNINYPLLSDEVILSDYLELEILRLKYGNVYSKIKHFDFSFLKRNNNLIYLNFTDLNSFPKIDFLTESDTKKIYKVLDEIFPKATATFSYSDFSLSSSLGFDLYFQNDIIGNISKSEIIKLRSSNDYSGLEAKVHEYYNDLLKREDILMYLKLCKRFISKEDFLNIFRILLKYEETSGERAEIFTQVSIAINQYKKDNIENDFKLVLIEEKLSQRLIDLLDKFQIEIISNEKPIIEKRTYDEIILNKVKEFTMDVTDNSFLLSIISLALNINKSKEFISPIEECAHVFREYFKSNPENLLCNMFYIQVNSLNSNEFLIGVDERFKLIYDGWYQLREFILSAVNDKGIKILTKLLNDFDDAKYNKISILKVEFDELQKNKIGRYINE